MFTVLGPLLFLALIGSALIGLAMLFVAVGMSIRPESRRWGTLILWAGLGGGVLGALALLTLKLRLPDAHTPPEAWILFVSAGFGCASLLAAVSLVLSGLLGLPNRWADRRKKVMSDSTYQAASDPS
jgi:hypothetical protein